MRRARSRTSRSLSARTFLRRRVPRSNEFELDTDRVKREARERDLYVCQVCSEAGKQVHHIDYDASNNVLLNLVTLCRFCHPKTNHDRDRWRQYFARFEHGKADSELEEDTK